MKLRWERYESVLATGIEQYLTTKRAVGCKFMNEDRMLRLFDRFLVQQGVTTLEAITPEVIETFMALRHRTTARSYNQLLRGIHRLFDWLVTHELLARCPVTIKPRRQTAFRTPCLFDVAQARALLEAAGRLPDGPHTPLRGPTYRTILALLYGLGLRIGEASRLLIGDIDWERRTLLVRDSKFGKTRLVPFGPRLHATLRAYVDRRAAQWGEASVGEPLFTFNGRTAVSTNAIRNAFSDELLPQLKLQVPDGTRRPHVHDLRHSFAVGVLLRWYRSGVDVSARLERLSTFLGHVHPEATAIYLTITAELLREANRRFEKFAPAVETVP